MVCCRHRFQRKCLFLLHVIWNSSFKRREFQLPAATSWVALEISVDKGSGSVG